MSFYLVGSSATPGPYGSSRSHPGVIHGPLPDPRRAGAKTPPPRGGAPRVPVAPLNDGVAGSAAAMGGGQVLRDVLARCATVRAYGGAERREIDFIDVPFEELHDAADARSLPGAARAMRALPRGDRER